MFLKELVNLLIGILILTGPFSMAWLTRAFLWPILAALIYTILAIILSAMLWSAAYGYGGYLMLSIPLAPAIFLYGWILIKFTGWLLRRREVNLATNFDLSNQAVK